MRITLTSGAEFEGIYANNPTDPSSCYLKMVQQKKGSNTGDVSNGMTRGGPGMPFQRKDITDARVLSNQGRNDGKALNGGRSFRTDAAISNSRLGAERDLKRWVSDTGNEVDGSLEGPGNQGRWDQFAENERLFGIKTDYDENIYTTTIDKNHPEYHQRLAAADRKAREIERSTASTAHVAEERIMDFVGGDDNRDEEEKYSGVRRQDFPPLSSRKNKYTPPARRAPMAQSNVKGAPIDPAIISSQLKAVPTPKQSDSKATQGPAKVQVPEIKTAEPKASETTAAASKLPSDQKKNNNDKVAAPLRSSAAATRTTTPQAKDGAPSTTPSATSTVERDVLNSFRDFATQQRLNAEKARNNKAKQDKQVKLTELKKFADSFKLSTPVPSDLISIIAKDPAKQKEIQAKALQNAEDIAKQKVADSATVEKVATASKDARTKPPVEPASATNTPAVPTDPRNSSRPSAPQHLSSGGLSGRHPGARQSYNPSPHYQQNYRNNRPPHMASQNQPTGNLAQRIREQQQKMHQPHHHMNQHLPVDGMRLPPTGPANSHDISYNRRLSGVPPPDRKSVV